MWHVVLYCSAVLHCHCISGMVHLHFDQVNADCRFIRIVCSTVDDGDVLGRSLKQLILSLSMRL